MAPPRTRRHMNHRGLCWVAVWLAIPVVAQKQGPPCGWTDPPRLLDNNGNISHEFRSWTEVMADAPPCVQPKRGPADTVSVRPLAHKPPKAAHQAYQRGLSAMRKKRNLEAIGHFGESVRLDPDYFSAHLLLGVLRGNAGQLA